MTKPRHKPYSGKLAKPLPKSKFDGLLDERFALEHERLILLLRHYGLNEDHAYLPPDQIGACWYRLSLALAKEYSPAFREEARGRRQTWSELDEAELYLRVKSLAPKHGDNVSKACRDLVQEPPYDGQNIDWGALRARFYQAQKKNRMVARWKDKERAAKRDALVRALRSCYEINR